MTNRSPRLTIVVPCYNEEEVLPETARRLGQLLESLIASDRIDSASAACFVDDGSRDGTWRIIRDLRESSPHFSGIKLSRNRGHQNALMAGLLSVEGDLIVSVDADLQDDLTTIERMVAAAQAGSDIVYGVRSSRATDATMKRWTAQTYYGLLRALDVEIVFDHADFRLMSRRAIEALRKYDEVNLFLRALIPQLGFPTSLVFYERAERFAGSSKYPLKKMLALAFEGVTSFSTRPLRLVTLLGTLISGVALVLSIWALVVTLVMRATIPGWASTVVPIYLISGVQLLCIGVIGEYVGKIYLETKRRPRFHISDVLEPIDLTDSNACAIDPVGPVSDASVITLDKTK